MKMAGGRWGTIKFFLSGVPKPTCVSDDGGKIICAASYWWKAISLKCCIICHIFITVKKMFEGIKNRERKQKSRQDLHCLKFNGWIKINYGKE